MKFGRKMESISSKFLISSPQAKFLAKNSITPLQNKISRTNFHYFPLIIRSKKSSYQDTQEYAKPSRLLPATDLKIQKDASIKETVTSFMSEKSDCLYKVKIQTSKIYGSGLSDINSGVLLCLIDENGSSILQRLSATRVGNDTLQFQRGSVDEFAFEGPKLGTIVAVWISVESGQWRIGGLCLTVISRCQPSSPENNHLTALQYDFEVDDILLGEKTESSMMEFRPHTVTTIPEDEFTLFDKKSLNSSLSLGNDLITNEESMKEYADLKFSLLFYDTALILAGSSILSFSTGENATYAFLTGGMCGFCYLLLLQRSVDGLPAQELIPSERQGGFGQIFGRLKGPILALVLAFAFAIATVKYASGDDAVKLTPKDVVFGMMGFLTCKVSVVLAAFKPMPIGFRDNKQSL